MKNECCHTQKGTSNSQLQTLNLHIYKPLFITVLYILLVTFITESSQSTWNWMHAMNIFMGSFFIGFSFFKMLNVKKFADTFKMYDPITKIAPVYGLFYPFIELLLGISYIQGCTPILTNSITLTILGIGTIGVVTAVLKKQNIQCACLGTVFNLPMTKVTIIENSVMIIMAVINIISLL